MTVPKNVKIIHVLPSIAGLLGLYNLLVLDGGIFNQFPLLAILIPLTPLLAGISLAEKKVRPPKILLVINIAWLALGIFVIGYYLLFQFTYRF